MDFVPSKNGVKCAVSKISDIQNHFLPTTNNTYCSAREETILRNIQNPCS